MIPIVWTEYTATVQGRILKLVPCENCATEYVYVLEREAMGTGTSFYLLNEDGAEQQAKSDAVEALQAYLQNDFDAVPCPVCGHYQRHMFPKLYDGGSMLVQTARLIVLMAACLAVVAAVYWSIAYFQRPGDRALMRLAVTLAALVVCGLIIAALSAAERSRARNFDANTGDQETRIRRGRSRAITRAEFEAQQRE
jgi:hypothetical protein